MKRIILFLICSFIMLSGSVFGSDFSSYKLPNNHTLIVKEVHDNPIVVIDTWFKVGSINENPTNNGIAHFIEHLFFKGTKNCSKGMFDKTLESKGAKTNAATSYDFTHYYITIPSKDFELAFKMHADMLLNPLFSEDDINDERQVVLEEISRSNDNTNRILFEQLISIFYKTSPYSRPVLGTKDTVSQITRQNILDFYNQNYVPSNMTTVVVGDVNAWKVYRMAKKEFPKTTAKKFQKPDLKNDALLTSPQEVVTQSDVKTGYLLMGFRGVDAKNEKDIAALDVLSSILGAGKSSRIYQHIKEKKELAYSIGVSHLPLKYDSLFLIEANFNPKKLDILKNEIKNEIKILQMDGVSASELPKAKSLIKNEVYFSREAVEDIAQEIGYSSVIFSSPKSYTDYLKNINDVQIRDIQHVANKYLDLNKVGISVILPKEFKRTENVNVGIKYDEKKEKKVSFWQSSDSTLLKKDKTIRKYKLKNDAILLTNANDNNNVVVIDISAKGGAFSEETPGTAMVLSEVLLKGTKNYDAFELAKKMEENGIKIVPSGSFETFDISLKTTRENLKLSLNLLNEILNEAKLSEYDIEKSKSNILNNITKSKDKTVNVVINEFKSKVFKDSIYANKTYQILEKSIPEINRVKVVEYYNQIFDSTNLVISVNGNVDDKYLIETFNKVFGKKTNKPINLKEVKGIITSLQDNEIVDIKKDVKSAWVLIGWDAVGYQDLKEYATFEVINTILGQGMSSRLFKDLRDKQSLAYQLGSAYLPYINRGAFMTYIATSPEKVEHSSNELLKQIELLKTEYVTTQELKDAKDKILGQYILSMETNAQKASILGYYETIGLGYEFSEQYTELIQSVTPSDIIGVANKYFSKPFIEVILAP